MRHDSAEKFDRVAEEGVDIYHYLDWSRYAALLRGRGRRFEISRSVWRLSICLQIFFNSLSEQRNILSSCVPEAFDIHPVVIMNEDVAHPSCFFCGKLAHIRQKFVGQMSDCFSNDLNSSDYRVLA